MIAATDQRDGAARLYTAAMNEVRGVMAGREQRLGAIRLGAFAVR